MCSYKHLLLWSLFICLIRELKLILKFNWTTFLVYKLTYEVEVVHTHTHSITSRQASNSVTNDIFLLKSSRQTHHLQEFTSDVNNLVRIQRLVCLLLQVDSDTIAGMKLSDW